MRYRHGSSMEVHDALLDFVLDLLSVEPENLSSLENHLVRVM